MIEFDRAHFKLFKKPSEVNNIWKEINLDLHMVIVALEL